MERRRAAGFLLFSQVPIISGRLKRPKYYWTEFVRIFQGRLLSVKGKFADKGDVKGLADKTAKLYCATCRLVLIIGHRIEV